MRPQRWEYKAFYLEQPHPDRGGAWYACAYDRRTRNVRRRSLRTPDFEEAKARLIALVEAAPARAEDAAPPRNVAAVHVLTAYLDGHAQQIASVEFAERTGELVAEYLLSVKTPLMSVAAWTPARQLEFARWLIGEKRHKPSTVERHFHVMGAAFRDAAKVKMRTDPMGAEVEGSLISHAPAMVWKAAKLAQELRVPDSRPRVFMPTLEEMAHFIDELKAPHLRRWILLALATGARPEAVTDLTWGQWDRRTRTLDLNPPGRPQTNKRRATVCVSAVLEAELEAWLAAARKAYDPIKASVPFERLSILTWQGQKIGTVKRAVRTAGRDLGLAITQKTPRTFMATMVRKLCPLIPRELRSRWLGHRVHEGSRTTDHYKIDDPDYLRAVALATDFVLCELQRRCASRLFAVEPRLKPSDLARIGAKPTAKKLGKSGQEMVGARGIEPLTPTMSR